MYQRYFYAMISLLYAKIFPAKIDKNIAAYTLKRSKKIQRFIAQPDKNRRFDWLISGPSKAVLDLQKGVLHWTGKSKAYINKQTKWMIETF